MELLTSRITAETPGLIPLLHTKSRQTEIEEKIYFFSIIPDWPLRFRYRSRFRPRLLHHRTPVL